jgi:hypothetical protein
MPILPGRKNVTSEKKLVVEKRTVRSWGGFDKTPHV